jgi:hypothetical protein
MAPQDAPFYPEIQALDENFYEFYYAYQRGWLERHQIDHQAVHSLWDILNNVWDNLDDLGISLDPLGAALQVVEEMNATAIQLENSGTATAEGIIFSGTREEYETIGRTLLEKLYLLETHVTATRQALMDMAQDY